MDEQILASVRELAYATAGPDDMLDFYAAARVLGIFTHEADKIDQILTFRAMYERGAL